MSILPWIIAAIGYLSMATALGAAWEPHWKETTYGLPPQLAYVLAMFWPITIAPAVAFIITRRRSDRDRVEAEVERRLAQERRDRETYMRRLERELGLGDQPSDQSRHRPHPGGLTVREGDEIPRTLDGRPIRYSRR